MEKTARFFEGISFVLLIVAFLAMCHAVEAGGQAALTRCIDSF